MYIKKKKINEENTNKKLENICYELLKSNEDVIFMITKQYEQKNGEYFEKECKVPIIFSTVDPKELNIPSFYNLDEKGLISIWCDEKSTDAKIIFKDAAFIDGIIKDKKICNLYLKIK